MKQCRVMLWSLALAAVLCACAGPAQDGPALIQVGVIEDAGFTVEQNGIWISPGGTAEFILHPQGGAGISDVQYGGDYRLSFENGYTRLELLNVLYPTRVKLSAGGQVRHIAYEANGGRRVDGKSGAVTLIYDTAARPRPNTSVGTDIFSRDGYTLVGWNTEPDGTGLYIGLGSRVTAAEQGMTLYAQWQKWTDLSRFTFKLEDGAAVLTKYKGQEEQVVIPAQAGGFPIKKIAAGAFVNAAAETVVFPDTLRIVENGAFRNCALRNLVLFDAVTEIHDNCFDGCGSLKSLYINAIEAPYGGYYRRESAYADKIDLLIQAQGKRKLVFYGGCSMWYNLIGSIAAERFGETYEVVNLGLNGTVNSAVQMDIMTEYLEAGDVLFHAPELSSRKQLLLDKSMDAADTNLWCGLEYNYGLFSLVDISTLSGVFDSLNDYLSIKKPGGSYQHIFHDLQGQTYMDQTGSIPFDRTVPADELTDEVTLDPVYLRGGLYELGKKYHRIKAKGVQVFVSYGCVNLDAVPQEQQKNVEQMNAMFHAAVEKMEGVVAVSSLSDYIYHNPDFYDTNYHMLTGAAVRNTELWLRDLAMRPEFDSGLLGKQPRPR